MRNLAFVSLLVISCDVCLATDTFSQLNDSLKNESTIRFYSSCLLDKGPCSGDGRAIKWMLPDLVASSCGKCSTKIRRVACRVVTILQQKKYADIWNALLKKYDPNVVYRKNLGSFLNNCEMRFKITIPEEEDEATTADADLAVAIADVNKKTEEEEKKALEKKGK